jgi:polyhydroxyalkanoate synthase
MAIINDCVEFICETHRLHAVNLLGICEGGIFTLFYVALQPEKVKNLASPSPAQVDFQADVEEGRIERGFINVWTRTCPANSWG